MNKSAVAIAVLAVLAPAWAARAAAPSDTLLACGNLTDSQARLQCFDRELAKSRPAAATPPAATKSAAPAAPVATPAAPAAAATATAASFGEEQLTKDQKKPAEPNVMHAKLTTQRELGSSRTYNLFLDNGQVWRHENSDLGTYLKDGDAVTITKGTMGSYRLTLDAGKAKNWIRVTRVR